MRTKHMSICRIPELLFLELYQMIGRMKNFAPADAIYIYFINGVKLQLLPTPKYMPTVFSMPSVLWLCIYKRAVIVTLH